MRCVNYHPICLTRSERGVKVANFNCLSQQERSTRTLSLACQDSQKFLKKCITNTSKDRCEAKLSYNKTPSGIPQTAAVTKDRIERLPHDCRMVQFLETLSPRCYSFDSGFVALSQFVFSGFNCNLYFLLHMCRGCSDERQGWLQLSRFVMLNK